MMQSVRRVTRRSLLGLAALLVVTATLPAQTTGTIEGTINGAGDRPLPDAAVSIVGTTRGARSDESGRFRITGIAPGSYQVRAQRIGYASNTQTATVAAAQTVTLNFALREAALSLDVLVVTGTAAESRKKEVGNAMATIDSKALEIQPVRNTQDILAGRAPGITVLSNSGQPGAGGTIKLRGTNSITQGTNPIIYVDGVRIYSDAGPTIVGARQTSLTANDIKADDIERIEIVKGAAATTLYGTEASGGVIQIFTKKGASGAPRWNLDVGVGQNFMGHVGPSDDPTGLFVNECRGSNMHDAFDVAFVDPTCPSNNTWLHRGTTQRHSLGVRGGGEALTYFLSTNFNTEQGVIGPGKQRDGGFRGNFAFTPARNVSLALNTSYNRKAIEFVPDGNLANGFMLNVARGPSNNFKGGKGECVGITVTCTTNAYVFDQKITNDADHFISGFNLQWSPISALTNRFNVGYDYNDQDIKTILPFGFLNGGAGSIANTHWYHTKLSLDYAGSLQNTFASGKFASTFSWGGQYFDDRERFTGVTSANFSGPGDPTLESGANITLGRDTRPRVVNAGFFLQEMVGWRDRLFLTLGSRIDGNSAFGSDFGLQHYPKVSASYIVSEESFWPSRLLPTMKLRAALGESGKAPGAFDAVRTWDPVAGDEGKPGVTVAQIGNPQLGPERAREVEFGFDVSGPGERVALEATYFNTTTHGALIGVTLPPSNGFSRTQLTNVGTIRNQGLEVQSNINVLRRASIDWALRANATWLANEALDVGNTVISTGLGSSVRDAYGTGPDKKHMPVPALYGFKLRNPDALEVQVPLADQYVGPVYPTRIFGAGTTINIGRSLSLDAQSEFQGGAYIVNFIGYQNALRNIWFPCYDAQKKLRANTITDLTALTRVRCAIDRTVANSDYWASKTDFFKLRSLSAAYTLPERFVRGAHSATLVLSGRNLWKWTKFDGADPEANDASDAGTGLGRREYYQLPPYKSLMFSIRTTF